VADCKVKVLDHGVLECDQELITPLQSLATAENKQTTSKWIRVPTFSLIIEHPEIVVGVDNGNHPEAMRGYWPEHLRSIFPWVHSEADEYANRLEQAGYAPTDLDLMVQSHLHLDHAGCLYLFEDTGVPVLVHEAEMREALYAAYALPVEKRGGYHRPDFCRDVNYRPTRKDRFELAEDLWVFNFPGHTPGVLGVLFRAAGRWYLYPNDGVWTRANYEQGLLPSILWSSRHYWDTTLPLVREIVEEYEATLVFSHDLEDFGKLKGYEDFEVVGG